MKILTANLIREADAFTIKNEPIPSVDLMERAATKLFQWFKSRYLSGTKVNIFVGPGNNGGDGWALGRLLWKEGYRNMNLFLLDIRAGLSEDSEINRKRLLEETELKPIEIKKISDFPSLDGEDILVDALFGSGISRPLDKVAAALVIHLNESGCEIVSVDVPSGLFSERNGDRLSEHIIKASYTLSFQFPKLAFLFPENDEFVGEWKVLPIGLHEDFIKQIDTPYFYVQEEDAIQILHPREKFSHKGNYGHAFLIAGSYGMMGAAVLAARACARSGVGLLTTHVPRMGVEIIQSSVPESLLSIDESDLLFSEHPNLDKFSAIAIGPGLNQKANTAKGLRALLSCSRVPLLIDADGLNLLSKLENWAELLPESSVLTPHPKEFERLFGRQTDSHSRLQVQLNFSEKYKCVVVLKGAHTCITTPDGYAFFNSTGNPGMAKGGSGDVLSGLILGLLAQKYPPSEAAILGVYLHGLAGDLSAKEFGCFGAIPSDFIRFLGKAYKQLEQKQNQSTHKSTSKLFS